MEKKSAFDFNPTIERRERRGDQWFTVQYTDGVETSCIAFTGIGSDGATQTNDTKIKIWRVENQYGCGPYAQSGRGNIHVLLHDVFDGKYVKIPLPHTDPHLAPVFNFRGSDEFLSGFASWDQYQEWFDTPEIRNLLAKEGFLVNAYEVSESNVIFGSHQVLFRRHNTTIINSAAANTPAEPSQSSLQYPRFTTKPQASPEQSHTNVAIPQALP